MFNSVKGVFGKECYDLKIDKVLAKKLHDYQVAFVNKNDAHVEFFGGHLLGVQVVRFTDADKYRWFDEILNADPNHLEDQLLQLPTINEDYRVSSDVFNLSCVWLTHMFMTNKTLSEKEKHTAMMDIMLVLNYKFFTSRLFQHFKWPANKATAEATYAALSNRFMIKQHENWMAVFMARCEDIIRPHGLHYNTLTKFDDDIAIVKMLNDTQGRIRDMLKNIYSVFMEIHRSGERIGSTSATIEFDGQTILRDKNNAIKTYSGYLVSVVPDKNSFIKEELVQAILTANAVSEKHLRQSLEWMSSNYGINRAKIIDEICQESVLHAFSYLHENKEVLKSERNLGPLLSKLRGVYTSSRNKDEWVLKLRHDGEQIAKNATGIGSGNALAGIRTAILMYLVARAISYHHYAG